MGMSYHHAPVRPRRAEEKRTHPAELTGFILLTVTAICTMKKKKYSVTILLIRAVSTFFSPRPPFSLWKSPAEALTTHIEIWTQPSLQNKLTASLRFIVDARARAAG